MNTSMKWVALCAAMLFASELARANLVVNGDFDTLTPGSDVEYGYGWTETPATDGSVFSYQRNAATFGALDDNDDTISQTIDTVVGAFYRIEFTLKTNGGYADYAQNHFSSAFSGMTFFTERNVLHDALTFDFLVQATSTDSVLSFSGANHPGYDTLRHVSVDFAHAPPVPEPETWALMGLGAVGLLARTRLRKGR